MYLEKSPSSCLSPYIEKLWCTHGYAPAHRRERVLPTSGFQLIIDLSSSAAPPVVLGMRTKHAIVTVAQMQCIVGVLFRPGGARQFFDAPAHELRNGSAALAELWGSDADDLVTRLQEAHGAGGPLHVLEAELHRRLRSLWRPHGVIAYALEEFGRDPTVKTVDDVARGAGLSRRRLADLFRECVGLTPKAYCRIRRFHTLVQRIESGRSINSAAASIDCGYYDQSHMAHEFREFSGISASTWEASSHPFVSHAVVD